MACGLGCWGGAQTGVAARCVCWQLGASRLRGRHPSNLQHRFRRHNTGRRVGRVNSTGAERGRGLVTWAVLVLIA